ncbi:MAG: rod shape-determining protein RodA [Acidobacteria bacterium]|nr:rod shape-determining protein RodA [Acidobacteriota bacterium]
MIDLSRKTFRDIDWLLLMAPVALTVFGCIGIYSTSPKPFDFVKKQLIALLIGLLIAAVVMFTDYRKIINEVAPFIYGAVLFLLVLVISPLGVTLNGNKAWLHIPGMPSIQPSEFAKVATILMLSRYLTKRRPGKFTLRDAAIMAAYVFPPVILIALEHDTGTMLVFGAILAVFYFLAGIPKKFVIAGVLALPLALIAVYPHLKGYQRERIEVILHPESADPKGFAYQTIQSMIAVGSGGPTGKGIGKGTQGQLGFLPYAYSDFIGAVIAEETGFIGILMMMALYLIFLWRLIAVALSARDKAGATMIMGFVALITFHILCNLGMVVGIMPIMGIPLPLMTAGGTSIMSMFAGVGLALSVRFRRFVN